MRSFTSKSTNSYSNRNLEVINPQGRDTGKENIPRRQLQVGKYIFSVVITKNKVVDEYQSLPSLFAKIGFPNKSIKCIV
jgi:hypothetical protein